MFWDKGYTPSQNIEALLEKENVTVEEFLDDEDILQECKTQKKNIVNYFTRPEIIKRLVELITTEPAEDLPLAQRFHYANMACEILTLGLPFLDEKLLSDNNTLKILYSYLENEPPLNPLLSSFFSKTFSMLFSKKTEQDWFLYQQMCLQLLEFIKSRENFLELICKHFDTPVIPDLIMQMMKDIQGGQLKRNLYEWLTKDKLVERLIEILRNPQDTEKHANVAEFLCDLIHQGRLMRQTEQENDSFEPAFDGSNPVLKIIESAETVDALLNVILEPNALESAIVSGVSVVLTLIKPIVFTDEPNSDRIKYLQNREHEIHEQIQKTVIGVIAPRLKDFVVVLKNPPNKPDIQTTVTTLSPPFGKSRLQICRIFTALLETKNETVSKTVCETDFFALLLDLFKRYCWNNFLHSEVEKCLHIIFYTHLSNSKNANSTQGSDGSYEKHMNNDDYVFNCFMRTDDENNATVAATTAAGDGYDIDESTTATAEKINVDNVEATNNEINQVKAASATNIGENIDNNSVTVPTETLTEINTFNEENEMPIQGNSTVDEKDTTKVPNNTPPSEIQKHLIVDCHLVSRLIECWQLNLDVESTEKGHRLGYMGHLIKIFKHITNCISESEHIGALIESSMSDENELKLWQSIIDPNDGDFVKAINLQTKLLANCNPHEEGDYSQHLPKDFLTDNSAWDYIMRSNVLNNLGAFNDSSVNDIVFTLDDDHNLFQYGRNIDDDDDDDDDNNAAAGGGDGHVSFTKSSLTLGGLASNPWNFADMTASSSGAVNWGGAEFGSDNFADFDAHFSTFSNELGDSFSDQENLATFGTSTDAVMAQNNLDDNSKSNKGDNYDAETSPEERISQILERGGKEEYDNNANVEKSKIDEAYEKVTSTTNPTTTTTIIETTTETAATMPTSSLVSALQSVLLDGGDDDYEDDEGMWTKPLGGSDDSKTANELAPATGNEKDESDEIFQTLTNGPSKETEELNNLSDKNITIKNNEQTALEMKLAATTNSVDCETSSTAT